MSSHFSGMSVVQRAVLYDRLNTQHLREHALQRQRINGWSNQSKALAWERAAVAAAMLVELSDVMLALKDPYATGHDRSGAKLLFDTIVKEAREYGHAPFRTDLQHGPQRGEPVGGVGKVLVAPAQHTEGAEPGSDSDSRSGGFP